MRDNALMKTAVSMCAAFSLVLAAYARADEDAAVAQKKPVAIRGEPDVVYLKNGGRVRGIISAEDTNTVELKMGGSCVQLSRSIIKSVYHASPQARAAYEYSSMEMQDRLDSQKKASAEDRAKRLKAYEDWTREETNRKALEQRAEGEVSIAIEPGSKAVLVEAVLNGDVKATLTLDTGADIIVLAKEVGERLGIDMSADNTGDIRELRLAGGKTARARMTMLKTVKIQGIEEKDVLAAVLLESVYSGFKEGLLGRSFLGRFNIKIDLEKARMTMQKLK
jgi:clan AA aspartic protease (TIGR02281 family)